MIFSVRKEMSKKFLKHTNKKDLKLIQLAADKFDKNIEKLNKSN